MLIVDDESPARRRLIQLLGRIADVEVAGEARSAAEAEEKLLALGPDAVLLDIQMPGVDGLSLCEAIADMPPVIFTTAYEEYAIRAFDLAAVDYLLKPIRLDRLILALNRARRSVEQRGHSKERREELTQVVARSGSDMWVFDAIDIDRFYAADKYTVFETGDREFLLEESLLSLEARLAEVGFIRIHRSELVNIAAIRELRRVSGRLVAKLRDQRFVPVSRRAAPALRQRLAALVSAKDSS